MTPLIRGSDDTRVTLRPAPTAPGAITATRSSGLESLAASLRAATFSTSISDPTLRARAPLRPAASGHRDCHVAAAAFGRIAEIVMPESTRGAPAVGVDEAVRSRRRFGGYAVALMLAACGGGGSAPSGSDAGPPRALPASVADTLDNGTQDPIVGLLSAGSANGDCIVMWLTEEGPRRQLWAVRYRASVDQWSEPQRISRSDVYFFNISLTADATGNAVAVWSELEDGTVAARFDAASGSWAEPVALDPEPRSTLVAGNDAGVVHVVGLRGGDQVFDPAAGVWRPSGRLLQTNVAVGGANTEALALDQAGHALGLYRYVADFELLGSNHFSPGTGQWASLPAGSGLIGVVPGSRVEQETLVNVNVTAVGQGDFIGAWNVDTEIEAITRVVVARYSGASGSWSTARTVAQVPPDSLLGVLRLRSGGGNTFALWRQTLGGRPAVRVLRLDDNGIACDDIRTVDSAVGGAAEWPDLAVDARGNAIAAWHQFDGTRNNIAFSRFDASRGSWQPAELAEAEPGDAIGVRLTVAGSQVWLTWVQREGNDLRIKAKLLPTAQP